MLTDVLKLLAARARIEDVEIVDVNMIAKIVSLSCLNFRVRWSGSRTLAGSQSIADCDPAATLVEKRRQSF